MSADLFSGANEAPVTECPNCGREINSSTNFCSGCGADFRDYEIGTDIVRNADSEETVSGAAQPTTKINLNQPMETSSQPEVKETKCGECGKIIKTTASSVQVVEPRSILQKPRRLAKR